MKSKKPKNKQKKKGKLVDRCCFCGKFMSKDIVNVCESCQDELAENAAKRIANGGWKYTY